MIISEKYKTDVVDKGNAVGISFASDVSRFVGNADSKIRAKVYNNLAKFDERLGSLIKVYGIIELEPSEEDKRLAFDPNIEYLILSLMDAENPVLKAFGVDKEKNVTVHEIQITE